MPRAQLKTKNFSFHVVETVILRKLNSTASVAVQAGWCEKRPKKDNEKKTQDWGIK